MRNIRKILAPLGVLALLSATTAFANEKFPGEDAAKGLNLPAVVAKVNGVDVPADHVKFEFNRIIRDIPGKPDPSQLIQLMQSIIDREVVRELVFQQAKKEKVKVDLMEIDRMVAAIKKGYASEQEWQAALSARGVDEAKIRDSIRVDLMARELLEEQVRGKVTITDAQVENFYQENKAKFQRPEAFRASHIFIAYVPPGKRANTAPQELIKEADRLRQDARGRMQKIYDELQAGAKFEDLAKKHSEDGGTAAQGGDLDFIYKGVFDPAFDEAVSKLEPGQTSGIVETSFGFHIIRLVDTKPAETASFEEIKESTQEYLFSEEAKKIVTRYVNSLRKKAEIVSLYHPGKS